MNAEQARKLAHEGFERLSRELQQGRSETLVAYLAALGRFHAYSFANVMLILSQKPDATRVAGFQTWKSFGRYVKKGEKGIVIIAPMLLRRQSENETKGEEGGEDPPQKLLRFRAVYVFDLDQTDGEALPEFARVAGDPQSYLPRLEAFVATQSIELIERDALGGALGLSRGGRIELASGLSPAERFAVLVHELAHEMLHQTDRPAARPSKCVRETEAEAVAFIVSQAIGLDQSTAAADYIQLYDGTQETLEASLERIQKTAAAIIAGLLETPG